MYFKHSRLLGGHELVIIRRAVFVIALMPDSAGETLLNELLRDVRVLVAVTDCRRLTLLVFAFTGTDKVDSDLDMLANEPTTEELARRVAEAKRRVADAQTRMNVTSNPYLVSD